jgi:hypothetical protein
VPPVFLTPFLGVELFSIVVRWSAYAATTGYYLTAFQAETLPFSAQGSATNMKDREFCLVLVMAVTLCGGVALGQDPLGPRPKKALTPADYKPQTLKQVAAEESKSASQQKDEEKLFVHGDLRPTRVRVTYAGRSRPLPKIKKAVLNRWAQLYAGAPMHYTVPYQTELLFKENGIEYWLAVRKESVAQFKKDFKKGDRVDLFLVRLGGTMTNRKWESLLLVENAFAQ